MQPLSGRIAIWTLVPWHRVLQAPPMRVLPANSTRVPATRATSSRGAAARMRRSSWAAGCGAGSDWSLPPTTASGWIPGQAGLAQHFKCILRHWNSLRKKIGFCLLLQFKRRGEITNTFCHLPESSPFEKIDLYMHMHIYSILFWSILSINFILFWSLYAYVYSERYIYMAWSRPVSFF